MLGVTLAPVTARMVSGIVAGEPVHSALGALSPERFA
jgi:glycine/D-amino acid oxidase-like deaminating enzyme